MIDPDPVLPFFPDRVAFRDFLLADLELGGKKVRGEEKVRKQVERNGES
jgi:hypothetical protein